MIVKPKILKKLIKKAIEKHRHIKAIGNRCISDCISVCFIHPIRVYENDKVIYTLFYKTIDENEKIFSVSISERKNFNVLN